MAEKKRPPVGFIPVNEMMKIHSGFRKKSKILKNLEDDDVETAKEEALEKRQKNKGKQI